MELASSILLLFCGRAWHPCLAWLSGHLADRRIRHDVSLPSADSVIPRMDAMQLRWVFDRRPAQRGLRGDPFLWDGPRDDMRDDRGGAPVWPANRDWASELAVGARGRLWIVGRR